MSTILNALKKSEKERSCKTLGEKIVLNVGGTAHRKGTLFWSCIVILLLLCPTALIYFKGRINHFDRGPAKERTIDTSHSSQPVQAASVQIPPGDNKNAPTLPEIKCSGVLWDGVEHVAIVDGRTLTEGQEIEGVKFVKIDLDRIEVLYKGEMFVVDLNLVE